VAEFGCEDCGKSRKDLSIVGVLIEISNRANPEEK
jgi:hypothetical protein